MSVLKELPSKQLLEQAAAQLAVDPTLVEKDWHVTQVLAFISKLQMPGFKFVFSGGTSLSKAHGLIKRFSEDLDFKVVTINESPSRSTLSGFKKSVLEELGKAGFSVNHESLVARDGNKFFSVNIDYNSLFPVMAGLRPHIQLEISISQVNGYYIKKDIQSLLGKLKNDPVEVDQITCTNPVEIAAEKLSALVWRLSSLMSGNLSTDRSLVRHIHDLAALEKIVQASDLFPGLVLMALNQDKERNKEIANLSNEEKLRLLLKILAENEADFRREYEVFVRSVSYALEGEVPTYDTAVKSVESLISEVIDMLITLDHL